MRPPSDRIVFIDDDPDVRAAQAQTLEIAGFAVQSFAGGAEALRVLRPDFPGVVVCDVRMPGMDGFAVYAALRAIDAEIPFVLLTGHGDIPMAVKALRDGVYDFLAKPFPADELIQSVTRALQTRRLVLENRALRRLHAEPDPVQAAFLGDSPAVANLRRAIAQVADVDLDVLIVGETGAGKEAAARALHRLSARRHRPFVHIHCASLAEESFQSELFGVEAGVRYGAPMRRSVGRLEKAQRGVVLLDTIETLTPAQQAKLVSLVDSREIWPVGAEEPRPFDARIIATAERDLRLAVEEGAFRSDLYYRLSAVSIRAPSLAERREDVRLLFQHALLSACARLKRPAPDLAPRFLAHLETHPWPGNLRELDHFAERVALGLEVGEASPSPRQAGGLAERVARYEGELIRDALAQVAGSAQDAARLLQLPRKTFYDKLARHGLKPRDFRG